MKKIDDLIQIYSESLAKDLPYYEYYKYLVKNNLHFGICRFCEIRGWNHLLDFINEYKSLTGYWYEAPSQVHCLSSIYEEKLLLELTKITLRNRLDKLKDIKNYHERTN